MPLDLSNIRDYNPKQFIVENVSNVNWSIGDLRITIPRGGSIDLLKLDSITKKPIRTFDQIANSRDLELGVELGKINIITEDGRLSTIDQGIAIGDLASLGDTTSGGGISGFTAGSVIFAGASGGGAEDNSNLFWDNSTNMLGIGTSSPEAPLHVGGDTPRGSITPGASGSPTPFSEELNVIGENSNTGAFINFNTGSSTVMLGAANGDQNVGFLGCAYADNPSGSILLITGCAGKIEYAGDGTLSLGFGLTGSANHTGTGTISTAEGLEVQVLNSSSGTITEARGINVFVSNSGTIDRTKAISVGSLEGTEIWGLYIDEDDADNFIKSPLLISDASAGDTTAASAKLEIRSTSRGFLPPRLTTTQRNDDIPSPPAIGLVIFNTTNDRLEVRADNGGSPRWEDMTGADAT